MTVDISVDLKAGEAYAELAKLETLLKSMGSDMESVNFDFGDFDVDDLADGIDDLIDSLEKADKKMSSIGDEIRDAANSLDEVGAIDVNHHTDNGGGRSGGDNFNIDLPDFLNANGGGGGSSGGVMGDGDGDAPALGSAQMVRAIERSFGFDRGSLSTELVDAMNVDEVNEAIADFYHDKHDSSQRERNLGVASIPGAFRLPKSDSVGQDRSLRDVMEIQDRRNRLQAMNLDTPSMDMRDAYSTGFFGRISGPDDDRLEGVRERVNGFESKLSRLKPTIGKFYTLLGLLSPLLIAAGVQAAGVAAAFGSIAVAGGAVIGLGLIGHADSLQGSMQAAKEEAQKLKQDLFNVFQPTAQSFAPISAEFLDFAPEELTRTSREMQGLVQFSDTLFNLYEAGVGGVTEFFAIINRNGPAVSDLTTRFAGLLGSGALDFFEFLLQSAADNQRLLISLGETLVSVAVIIFNVSMAVGRLATTFLPFVKVVAFLSGLLNNKFGMALLMVIAYTYILSKATLTLGAAYSFMQTGLKKAIAFLGLYEANTWRSVAATLALAGALSLVTFGISALAGGLAFGSIDHDVKGGNYGPGSGGPNFGGGGVGGAAGMSGGGGSTTVVNNYNFENHGSMNSDTEQRFRSEFKRMGGEESAKNPPSPSSPSLDSTTKKDGGNSADMPSKVK